MIGRGMSCRYNVAFEVMFMVSSIHILFTFLFHVLLVSVYYVMYVCVMLSLVCYQCIAHWQVGISSVILHLTCSSFIVCIDIDRQTPV